MSDKGWHTDRKIFSCMECEIFPYWMDWHHSARPESPYRLKPPR